VFSIEYLHVIRGHEIDQIAAFVPPGSRVLEIGAGTGEQARRLAERGVQVTSIDVPASRYDADRVFPIVDYDGKVFPFEDGSFDVVFSSNVLEHVTDLEQVHREVRRVLGPGGLCIHVMPSASWRFWEGVTHYVELAQVLWRLLPDLLPRALDTAELRRCKKTLRALAGTIRARAFPSRHGERGSAISELWTFSRFWWRNHFRTHGLAVTAHPMDLFYTGHLIFGARLSLETRRQLARVLGASSILYVVRPVASSSIWASTPEARAHPGASPPR
jgi:SAM-dependent methyltransferase